MSVKVIKLGGSLVSPSDENILDYKYIDSFKSVIDKFISKDEQFAIAIGGGRLCRKYQQMARDHFPKVSERDLHWIGIATINLNAQMLKSHWGEEADENIIRYESFENLGPEGRINQKTPILICAAESPGHSSDMDAVKLAIHTDSKEIYRLTDVDAIYDKDPKKYPDAIKIPKLSWQEYYDVLGIKEFEPGGHFPFDPIASQLAEKHGIKVVLMSGHKLTEFEKALNGENFDGSVIG